MRRDLQGESLIEQGFSKYLWQRTGLVLCLLVGFVYFQPVEDQYLKNKL